MSRADTLTRVLAVAGTVCVLLSVLSVGSGDWLMPGTLFPVVLAGGAMLAVAAYRAGDRIKMIVWGLGTSCGALIVAAMAAWVLGLLGGGDLVHQNPSWAFGYAVVIVAAYISGMMAMLAGAALLLRDLFRDMRGRGAGPHGRHPVGV